jgi:mRNA-degrading endonuclease toxin of MazEF toxin-antitoxin module
MRTGAWTPLPGDIVFADVQYADSEQRKSRFAVVVSARAFNEKHPDVVVAFATSSSNIRRLRDYDVEISEKHLAFQGTGLYHSTTIRSGRLWSLDQRKIVDVRGVVPKDLLGDILRLVRACFDDA